jgi:hypothetical protein
MPFNIRPKHPLRAGIKVITVYERKQSMIPFLKKYRGLQRGCPAVLEERVYTSSLSLGSTELMDHVGDHTRDVQLTLSGKSQRGGSADSSAKRGVAAYTKCRGIIFLHVLSRYLSVNTSKLLEMV